MTPEKLNPTAIRYIKLGRKNKWAAEARSDGIIPLGFAEADHEACLNGDIETIKAQMQRRIRRTAMGAAQDARELMDFYNADPDTLWITFAQDHMWWTFAEGPVIPVTERGPDGYSRYRKTRGEGWQSTDLNGKPLRLRDLSSLLTQTASYQRTICQLGKADYALRKIRGVTDPLPDEAQAVQALMVDMAQTLIACLHWKEFETLADLVFARGGWRRVSLLGKDMPVIDLLIDQPITGETAWVQVKSKSRQAEFDTYVRRFVEAGTAQRLYYVCHTLTKPLTVPDDVEGVTVLTGEPLARLVIEVGLFQWLIDQSR